MAAGHTSRALLSGVRSVTNVANQQIRQRRTSSLSYKGIRCVSLAANARQQLALIESYIPEIPVSSMGVTEECNNKADIRKNHLLNILHDDATQRTAIQSTESLKRIQWNDGQISGNLRNWRLSSECTPRASARRRSVHALRRYPWGSDHQLKEFDYESIKRDDRVLLDWLVTMETKGCAMLKNVPKKDVAGPKMIKHIAFVKQSHYGSHSPTSNSSSSSNVALPDILLGMQNENKHTPEIIFIRSVEQPGDTGSECFIADGLSAAEILRKEHPESFEILSSIDPYFWENGHTSNSWGMDELYNTDNMPMITIDRSQQMHQIAINIAIRDSNIDLPAEKEKSIYFAMKLFNDILYDNSVIFKMDSGDMMTLDNVRCVFGHEGYEDLSRRHIECSYLSWDEARVYCRRIQEKLETLVIL